MEYPTGSLIPAIVNGWLNDLDKFVNEGVAPIRREVRAFPLDVEELEDAYVVSMNVPGVARDNIDIVMEGNNLSVTVRQTEPSEEQNRRFIHRERRFHSGNRTVFLRLATGSAGVTAELRDGVLNIKVNKDQEKQPRKVNIS